MIRFLRTLQVRRKERRLWQALEAELEHNLETYYVMSQLKRLKVFVLEAWVEAEPLFDFPTESPVRRYAAALGQYNRLLSEAQEFETWYGADVERQTRDHARFLHDKKEAAWSGLTGLEPVIQAALADVRAASASGMKPGRGAA